MALKQPFMLKTVVGNTDLELEADTGEAFKVKDIFIYNPASNYITIRIDKVTVGYFRVGGVLGSHLPFPQGQVKHSHDFDVAASSAPATVHRAPIKDAGDNSLAIGFIVDGSTAASVYKRAMDFAPGILLNKTILGLLKDLGLFEGYPVAEGQKFVISGAKQAGAIQMVLYEIYDPADISSDMPGGSASSEYIFLNYGNTGGNINKTGDTVYNTPQSPAEFPDFPFGKDVPARTEVDLIGILASDFAPGENDGTNYILTQYLKLVRAREVMFDEDRNGLLLRALQTAAPAGVDVVGEGMSVIGNYSDVDARLPLLFPSPITFHPGEELGVYLTTTSGGTGQNIATDEHEICLIQRVRAVGGGR